MLIAVVVHPVNTLAHPSVPPGFRWAVHVGMSWSDTSTCLNGGWEPDVHGAMLAGDACAVVGVRVARLCGQFAEFRAAEVIDFDPIPAGQDLITVE